MQIVHIVKQLTTGIILASLLGELLFRVLTPFSQPLRFYTQYSRKIHNDLRTYISPDCALKPNSLLNGFVINSRGNYSPEYPYAKPTNIKRLVVVGDSQLIFSAPYPKSFSRLLENQLNTSSTPTQVINLGIPCIGPLIEKSILAEEGIRYEPNVVLLSLFVGNDFTDDQVYKDRDTQNVGNQLFVQQLIGRSYLASFLKTWIVLNMSPKRIPSTLVKTASQSGNYIGYSYEPNTPTFSESDYQELTSNLATILIPGTVPSSQIKAVQQSILDMQYAAKTHNATFIVLIIPAEFQLNMELLASAAAIIKRPISSFDVSYPQNLLKQFLENQHIQYVDLLSYWISTPSATSYFHPRDTHLNIEGNQSVADILYPVISAALKEF